MHRLARVFFHQGHMLVGSRMEDILRTEAVEDALQPVNHTNITHDRLEMYLREFVFQLEADVMHRGLGTVEEDQLLQSEGTELTAEFATDRTGGTRYHHHLAFEGFAYLVEVDLDLITAQQVFDLDFRQGFQSVLFLTQYIHGRENQHLHQAVGTVRNQPVFLLLSGFLAREYQGFERPVFIQVPEIFFRSDGIDGQSVQTGRTFGSDLDEPPDLIFVLLLQ